MSRRFFTLLAALLALAALLQAAPAPAQSRETLLVRGSEYLHAGDMKMAVEMFSRVLAMDPGDQFALNQRGVALLLQGRGGEALDDFNRARKLDDDNVAALLNKGVVQFYRGGLAEAESSFRGVLARDAGNGRAHYYLGLIRLDQGRRGEAVAELEEARRLGGREYGADPDLLFDVADLYARQGMLLSASLALGQALDLNPRHAPAMLLQGEIFDSQGKGGLAVAAWRQAVEVEPGCWEARRNLCLALTGRAREAIAQEDRTRGARLLLDALDTDMACAEAEFLLHKEYPDGKIFSDAMENNNTNGVSRAIQP